MIQIVQATPSDAPAIQSLLKQTWQEDKPGNGGGNYFVIDTETKKIIQDWTPID